MSILEQMVEYGHERVAFAQDPESGLRAIIAIHSTELGNALGGTRRWHYPTEADAVYDVLRLAEGMTYKAACANLPMGGAKSVILLPKPGHKASEAEAKAMGRFVDTFSGTYIAAEDVGTTPQFIDWMATETPHVMGGVAVSRGGDPSPFTARGVYRGMRASLAHLGREVEFDGVRVAIQGVGSVGYHLASILTEQGAQLIVSDINEANLERAKALENVQVVEPDEILTADCDILAPCALGGVIDGALARKLNCRVVCGAANNVLDDPDEDAALLKNAGVLYAPDFVVNAGGLIELAGLYLGFTREQLDEKHARIEATTIEVLAKAESATSTYAAAIALARQRIAEGVRAKSEHGAAREVSASS